MLLGFLSLAYFFYLFLFLKEREVWTFSASTDFLEDKYGLNLAVVSQPFDINGPSILLFRLSLAIAGCFENTTVDNAKLREVFGIRHFTIGCVTITIRLADLSLLLCF